MKFGLTNNDINKINDAFLNHHQIEKAILYGSRAKGNYRNGSDIDLTLIGQNLSLKIMNEIALELDDLLLPYLIDLSAYHQIQNPDLIDHIDRNGQIFYQKKSD